MLMFVGFEINWLLLSINALGYIPAYTYILVNGSKVELCMYIVVYYILVNAIMTLNCSSI